MHLSGELVRRIFAVVPQAIDHIEDDAAKHAMPSDFESLVETARLYGLLHDIGHGPFGHLLDQVWLKPEFDLTHEQIAKHIIQNELRDRLCAVRRSPYGPFEQQVDLDSVCRLVCGEEPPADAPYWERTLWQALCGLYSPDKLDYLARDAHFCGTPEYGTVDVERLLLHSFVALTDVAGLAVHASGLPALADLLAARLAMYENVYYHRTARAADSSFAQLLPRTLQLMELGDPTDDLEAYFALDEFALWATVAEWARNGDNERRAIGLQWVDLLEHRIPLREAFAWRLSSRDASPVEIALLGDPDAFRTWVRGKVKAQLGPDDEQVDFTVDAPGLDVRPRFPLLDREQVAVFVPHPGKPGEGDWDTRGAARMLAGLPVKYVACRIFCRPELLDTVRNAAQKALDEEEPPLQNTMY